MRKTLSVICLLACVAIAIPMLSQGQKAAAPADPLSGTWTGDWGPNANDRNQVSVDLKWDGKALTGTVHSTQPKRDDVAISKATYTAATGALHMEAEAKSPRGGQMVHYMIDTKVAGSSMTGTWNHDAVKGDVKLTKK